MHLLILVKKFGKVLSKEYTIHLLMFTQVLFSGNSLNPIFFLA